MDSAPAQDSADPSESNDVAVVGEKRPAVEVEGGRGDAAAKRRKNGGGCEPEMRRIAEIVLVLSAMGTMRGGRDPTAVEKEMMSEARAKVVSICEGLAPKDIMPRELFCGIIEDLGLNRLKEQQRLGFRPSKPLSIVEKMELSKKRMGESKSFTPQAAVDLTQRAQSGVPTALRPFPSDKASHMPTSAGSFQHTSPIAHVSPATSTILSFQPPGSQVSAPAFSTGLPNSNLGRDSSATARVERPHLRSDGRVNGLSQAPQAPAGFVGKTTPAFQTQSIPSNNISIKNKLPDHMSVKIEGNANFQVSQVNSQATHVQASNLATTQAVPGTLSSMHHPIQGMPFVHAATLMSHHPEISKIVQKILHPKPADRPSWTPPSKDYMSKSLTCQICKLLSNEVDNLLVCDACEKGFHLKCLQSCNQKFVPRGEWYCPRCTTISGGKPFPPKYGRVTRNMVVPKISSNSAAVQSPSEKILETEDQNANQQIIVTNTKPDEINAPHGGIVVESTEEKTIQRIEMHGSELSAGVKKEEVPSSESCPGEKQQSMGDLCVSTSAGSLESKPAQHVLKPEAFHCEDQVKTDCTSAHPPGSDTADYLNVSNSLSNVDHAGSVDGVGVLPEQKIDSNQLSIHSEKSDGRKSDDCNPKCNFEQNDQDAGQVEQIVAAGIGIQLQNSAKSLENMHNVDWIGPVQVVDNKRFYQSCLINGVVYKLQDFALVQSNNGKLIPSKLQIMWEDSQTGSMWVAANRCYFPDDLPATVGRPSAPEENEVYESNDESTLMVELIKGPCDVLQTKLFGEANKKGDEENGDRPIFSCRWFYDKIKGVFCPIPR